MDNSENIEVIHIRCPIPLKRWVEQEAAKNYRSQSAQVLAILSELMREQQAAGVR
jgi:hypothetical protein